MWGNVWKYVLKLLGCGRKWKVLIDSNLLEQLRTSIYHHFASNIRYWFFDTMCECVDSLLFLFFSSGLINFYQPCKHTLIRQFALNVSQNFINRPILYWNIQSFHKEFSFHAWFVDLIVFEIVLIRIVLTEAYKHTSHTMYRHHVDKFLW